MKFTVNQLKRFLDTNITLENLVKKLTNLGLEVENVEYLAAGIENLLIAKIVKFEKHPDADKLNICSVDAGAAEIDPKYLDSHNQLQIICGASNVRENMMVVLAPVGTTLSNGMKIKAAKIRGIASHGMLCSGSEIGLSLERMQACGLSDTDGILELPNHISIGGNFAEFLEIDDHLIEVAITPNRGDCASIYGIARDLASAGCGKLKIPDSTALRTTHQKPEKEAEVANFSHVPLLVTKEIKNLTNNPSPLWLQKFLLSVGKQPISAIVDITNYVSYAYGRPLHAYDSSKVSTLVYGKSNKEEKFLALNGIEYDIQKDDIIIKDSITSEVHGLAGIIGGENSSCSQTTKNILLEAAVFCSEQICKTSQRLNITTDSRFRFERGVDANFTETGLQIAANLIEKYCGGEQSKSTTHGSLSELKIVSTNIDNLLNKNKIEISRNEAVKILESLGMKLSNVSGEDIIRVPSWRHDINIEQDLLEELLRISGYENIKTHPLELSSKKLCQENIIFQIKRNLITTTTQIGANEIISWSFTSHKSAEIFTKLEKQLFLANPISQDLNYLRPNIISSLAKIIGKNHAQGQQDINFFEIGPVFAGKEPSQQWHNFCYAVTGSAKTLNHHSKTRSYDFFDLKGDLEHILVNIGVNIHNLTYDSNNLPNYMHPGTSASLSYDGELIGIIGSLHPINNKLFGLKRELIFAELSLAKIISMISKSSLNSKVLSSFPEVVRDYSFTIHDPLIEIGNIIKAIRNSAKKIIKDVILFDIYHSDDITKKIALRVKMQALDRTLTESEIAEVGTKIITKAKALGATFNDI